MRAAVVILMLWLGCAAAVAAAEQSASRQPRRSSVVTTTPLPDSAPMEVTTKQERSKEREYCMRLFTEPEFVRSCIRNRTWKR